MFSLLRSIDNSRLPKQRCALLHVEALEGRDTPSIFYVDTLTDSHDANPGDFLARDSQGLCSLRAAIEEANTEGGYNTIYFTPPLAGTISLTIGTELNLASDIQIYGPGHGSLTIERPAQAAAFRIFDVWPKPQNQQNNFDCLIKGVTIRNGDGTGLGGLGSGGGIINQGDLHLEDVFLRENTGPDGGGAIFNQNSGNLWMLSCTVTKNEADDGGGIYNKGHAIIDGCTIDDNKTTNGSGGGIYNAEDANISLFGTSVTGNHALLGTANGGGVYNGGDFQMQGGCLSGNGATNDGGGLFTLGTATISFVSFTGNGAARGGGFFLHAGSLRLSQSTIMGNFAGLGTAYVIKAGATFIDGGGNTIQGTIVSVP